jgi:dTDP-4-dehydrorhamnose reductase
MVQEKILILGAGYVGTYLYNHMPDSILCKERLFDIEDVEYEINKVNPTVVINCIGKTGYPNVDWCEDNKSATCFGNTIIPAYIASVCKDSDIHFINMGTGCVFDAGIFEDDATPNYYGSFYSRTKLMAEEIIHDIYDKTTTLRIRMPISKDISKKNYIVKTQKYNKIINERNSVTFLTDLLNIVKFVIENKMYGKINTVHPKTTSLAHIFDLMGNNNYEIISTEELNKLTKAGRSTITLVPKRLLDAGFTFVDFDEELIKCIEVIKQ